MARNTERKRSLLEKYEMPLNHLDFGYIDKCSDAREMEKILQILRSGEEGYYPDLMQCAENKLRELKPNSKMFRMEEQLRGRESLAPDEWQPYYDWTNQIKVKDSTLAVLKTKNQQQQQTAEYAGAGDPLDLLLPPIRLAGKIREKSDEQKSKEQSSTAVSSQVTERIKSTDYSKWDKYDADEELLRMELAEERVQEEVERKNRLNLQKSQTPKIVEITEEVAAQEREQQMLQRLTVLEREQLAENYRLRGNEYFRDKEYAKAIEEYDRSIKMHTEGAAPAYNNRAIANIKLHKYLEAIGDCESCLEREPLNIKAWLRKAEAKIGYGRKREAYEIYQKVLAMEPDNAIAMRVSSELRTQLGDLPPPHATRLQIQEAPNVAMTSKETKPKPKAKPPAKPTKPKDYDLANLVVPNNVVKNKFSMAAAALGQSMQKPKLTNSTSNPQNPSNVTAPQLRLPQTQASKNQTYGKLLIEEI